jgi:DNA-binding CsgD family transcriptional regulator
VVSYPAEPEPLRIVVSSLATPGLAVAALFVAPPAQGRQSDAELLRRLFALTRVEAEVAELLCRGHTPEEIARLMRLSLHTIRAHLRAVFTKTGARRQADLVRVVLRGAGALQL